MQQQLLFSVSVTCEADGMLLLVREEGHAHLLELLSMQRSPLRVGGPAGDGGLSVSSVQISITSMFHEKELLSSLSLSL